MIEVKVHRRDPLTGRYFGAVEGGRHDGKEVSFDISNPEAATQIDAALERRAHTGNVVHVELPDAVISE